MADYSVRKGSDGFEAQSFIALAKDRRQLRITTCKRSRGIATYATVVQLEDHGFSFRIFEDYSKAVEQDKAGRCTEKNVRAMHERALAQLPAILAEVEKQYGFGAADGGVSPTT